MFLLTHRPFQKKNCQSIRKHANGKKQLIGIKMWAAMWRAYNSLLCKNPLYKNNSTRIIFTSLKKALHK